MFEVGQWVVGPPYNTLGVVIEVRGGYQQQYLSVISTEGNMLCIAGADFWEHTNLRDHERGDGLEELERWRNSIIRQRVKKEPPKDKNGQEIEIGDIVKYDLFEAGPGRPYQEPSAVLMCFVVAIDQAGEVWMDPRIHDGYKEAIHAASRDISPQDWEEIGYSMLSSDTEGEIEIIHKTLQKQLVGESN